MANASGKSSLICPLEHESGVLGAGPSLEYRLWNLLAGRIHPPTPLELSNELDLVDAKNQQANASVNGTDIQEALERSKYFVQTGAPFCTLVSTVSNATFASSFESRLPAPEKTRGAPLISIARKYALYCALKGRVGLGSLEISSEPEHPTSPP